MQGKSSPRRLVVAITGASGSIYAKDLLRHAVPHYDDVYVIVSATAQAIMKEELGADDIRSLANGAGRIAILDNSDLTAPPASGSHRFEGMVIVPCSMGILGRIAAGTSNDLITRAADVCLKEGRRLILVPRETPLNTIHLENMLKLSRAGAVILPASPPFYHKPKTIDDVVNAITARILSRLGIEQTLVEEWKS